MSSQRPHPPEHKPPSLLGRLFSTYVGRLRSPWMPAIVTAFVGACLLALCLVRWAEWREMHAAVQERLERYSRYQQLSSRQRSIESSLTSYSGYLAVSPSEDAAFRQLLALVEQTASSAGVQITGVKPRPALHASDTAEYTVEIECTASIEALVQLIHGLEYAPALLRVDRLRLNAAPQDSALLQAHLLITYTNLL